MEFRNYSLIAFLLLLLPSLSGQADPLKLELHKQDAPLSVSNPSALTNSVVNAATPSAASVPSANPDGGQIVDLTTTSTVKTAATASTLTPVVVTFNGQKFGLKPNPVGIYPRVTIPAKAFVAIHLNVSAKIQVEVLLLNGGVLGKKDRSSVQIADAGGNIDFTYAAPGNPGSHRIAFITKGKKQILKFWIGPDLPMKIATAKK